MMNKTSRRRRGYLLLEVSIAGAISAAALVGLLSSSGNTLALSSSAARDLTARGLVQQGVEQVRARGFGGVSAHAATAVTSVKGAFTREIAVTTGNETLFGSQSTAFKDVTVIVSHPVGTTTKTYQATVRLYE
jgi:hypothetical protein